MGRAWRVIQGGRTTTLAALLMLGLLSSCIAPPPPQSLPTRLYDGPARPTGLIAVIGNSHYDYVVGGWRADLETIDGTEVDPTRVEVLPGRHVVGIGGKICIAGVCSGTVPATLTFTAVAGHAYRAECDYWLSEVTLRDVTEDRVVARVACDDGQCTDVN